MAELCLKPTITVPQAYLVCDIEERGSCKSLKYAVKNKELADFQTTALAFATSIERCLISLDTGLGKTLVATGIINVLQEQYDGKFKWIIVVQNNNLLSTFKKIKDGIWNQKACVLDAVTASIEKLFARVDMLKYDIFIISYEAICNPIFNKFLYDNIEKFDGIIVDESHTIGNMASVGSKMVREVMQHMRFRYMLTATPMMVNPAQVINQIYMIDPDMFSDVDLKQYKRQFEVRENGRVTGFKDLDDLQEDIAWRYLGATRKDLGVKGNHTVRVIMPDPKPEYLELKKMDTFLGIKADYAGPAMQAFMQLVLDKKARGEIGVAYVNLNKTKVNVAKYFEEAGIRVGILDGMTTNTNEKKEKVHQAFLNGEYDILLTNITTGRDLQCNYLVFYELTYDFQQYLGRGERGLQGNDLDIIFFIVKDTEEVTYFHDNMLERAEMLELIGQKDVDTLKKAYEEMKISQRNKMLKLLSEEELATRQTALFSAIENSQSFDTIVENEIELMGTLASFGGWIDSDNVCLSNFAAAEIGNDSRYGTKVDSDKGSSLKSRVPRYKQKRMNKNDEYVYDPNSSGQEFEPFAYIENGGHGFGRDIRSDKTGAKRNRKSAIPMGEALGDDFSD